MFRLGPGLRRPDPSAPAAGAVESTRLITWRTGARIYSLTARRFLADRNSAEELLPVLPRAAPRPTTVTSGTSARGTGGARGCSPLRGVRPAHIRLQPQRADHLRNPVFGPRPGLGHAADTWNAAPPLLGCDSGAWRQQNRTREAWRSRAPRSGARSAIVVLRSSSL